MSSTAQNLTLLTDLYELTMMQGYFKNPVQETVIFDAFYRVNPCGNGYAIAEGWKQVIDYIKNLRFSEEDVEYLGSLGIFEKDFLDYLKDFRFQRRYLCNSGRNCGFSKRASDKSDCSHYGSAAGRNGDSEYY